MDDAVILRSGEMDLDVAMGTTAEAFEKEFDLDCNGVYVPFMYIPRTASIKGLSASQLVGYVGLIVNTDTNQFTYVVLGEVDSTGSTWGHISERAARNLGFHEYGYQNYIKAHGNFSIYVYPSTKPAWDLDMTAQQQVITYGIQLGGLTETVYSSGSAGVALGNSIVNVDSFDLYIITIPADGDIPSPETLEASNIAGVMLDGGCLFNKSSHTRRTQFQSSKLSKQIAYAKENDILYGLIFTSRARNRNEAKEELYEIGLIVRTYSMDLGVWIIPELTDSETVNNGIIDVYGEELMKMGLTDIIGLYATPEQMKKITWENYMYSWFLWLVDHIDSLTGLEEQLTPEFFNYDA